MVGFDGVEGFDVFVGLVGLTGYMYLLVYWD